MNYTMKYKYKLDIDFSVIFLLIIGFCILPSIMLY